MKKSEVKLIFQKLIMAIVIVSLICPWNLWAARKGARVTITRLDGKVVEGRLLKVEEDSLLLRANAEGIIINVKEIYFIRVIRKSKAGQGALIGSLGVGAAVYGITRLSVGSNSEGWGHFFGCIFGAIGALVGLILGAGVGSSFKGDKIYRIKGKAQYEIKFILRKLKKKARFKN